MGMESQNIIRSSATSSITPAPHGRERQIEITKLIDVTCCTGCKGCMDACGEWNNLRGKVGTFEGSYQNPPNTTAEVWTTIHFKEIEEDNKFKWLFSKHSCMHCSDPGCLKACPELGAIVQYENGVVDFDSEKCVGCGYCIAGCPFDIPRMNPVDNRVYKCTLCLDRLQAGQVPSCVKTCPTGALRFGSREEILEYANERVAALKAKGHSKAGIYNPEGVNGTHVIYILHDVTEPERYDLPKDPKISETVKLWKDDFKPLAAAGIVGTLALAAIHRVTVGRSRVKEEEERNQKGDEK
ncbi:formate dehydrogenase subunit beta [Photobacterium damselae subsp. piscicida]|uniref:Formate dehydrogenase iron-sulfur subunit n=2 Tax=Photobacterium damselae TaxID=38293 RepID=A0A1Q9H6Z1_PHODP|nr:formate dehydrogenase subunit beta [Photobacterium damselae]MBE8129976.1 formate dehydrogenase subunit beta [Photobacterium damselae subsp. piscicida]OLQ83611.1 formate dehydrogenase subunit beta [Photobacterium damselae subsp. piscicida]PSV76435.1 formate dehydrogenase subunit beta [Photobacterium damselae]PSW79151.1 formate dehydrogenase subunit beta [Photobacterium damselae]QOD52163.1 formate dehydrogenase subunit beta [Photobacterium damselae subsp. piscicida]